MSTQETKHLRAEIRELREQMRYLVDMIEAAKTEKITFPWEDYETPDRTRRYNEDYKTLQEVRFPRTGHTLR
jgi:hypothetical protein